MTAERSPHGTRGPGGLGPWLRLALVGLLRYPHRLVPGALGRHGARPAFGDGTTFATLLARVRRLAGHWAGRGVRPGDRVLLDLPNDPAFLEARLACLLGGFVAVPVPPGTDGARLGWLGEFSEARTYLGPRAAHLPGLGALALDPLAGDRGAYEGALGRAAPLARAPRIRSTDLVTLNFTSGTTGDPKGVMSTAAGWGASLYGALRENRVPVEPGEVFLHALPLATAGSSLILPAVLSGAQSLFLAEWDPERAATCLADRGVTRVFLTPTMLAELLDVVAARGLSFPRLKAVIYGTEGIPVARVKKALALLGPVLQQGYGMAEALPPVCLLHPDEHRRGVEEGDDALLGSVGRPTRAVDLCCTAPDGTPVPPGTAGSIRLRGPTLSPGYWRRPDLTAASRAGGYYRTGDVGHLDHRGYLRVLGREGRLPEPRLRRLVEWAEGRPEASLAWGETTAGGTPRLGVVPARGHRIDPEEFARQAAGALGGGAVEVTVWARAPLTPSLKLAPTGSASGPSGDPLPPLRI